MRTLLLLRGAPGSGKSTFIKQNHLEDYTISSDTFRIVYGSYRQHLSGNNIIDGYQDHYIWEQLLACLEYRMEQGLFTVVDATHITSKSVKPYEKLAERYRYSIYYLQFDLPLEECLRRNRERDSSRWVPEDTIRRMYNSLQEVEKLPSKCKRIDSLSQISDYITHSLDGQYRSVKVIGDLQGCYSVLIQALEGTELSPDIKYIFVGDFLDRGIENDKVFEFIHSIHQLSNVVLIEGNHERYLRQLVAGEDLSTAKEFTHHTLRQLHEAFGKERTMEMGKEIVRKLVQCYAFEIGGQKYLVTHGGLAFVEELTYIPTSQMIQGTGNFADDIDMYYEKNYVDGKCRDFTQVHGHRYSSTTEHSIGLECGVEFGGLLRILDINDQGEYSISEYENTIYRTEQRRNRFHFLSDNPEVNKLIVSPLVDVKPCKPNLLSINFTRDAFNRGLWNDVSVKARGLFLDKNTAEVRLRSYDKFFNYKEMPETTPESLKVSLNYPVTAMEKYNGYLCLLSVVDGELVFASKTTTEREHALLFKSKFMRLTSSSHLGTIKEFIENHRCTLVFEGVLPLRRSSYRRVYRG